MCALRRRRAEDFEVVELLSYDGKKHKCYWDPRDGGFWKKANQYNFNMDREAIQNTTDRKMKRRLQCSIAELRPEEGIQTRVACGVMPVAC